MRSLSLYNHKGGVGKTTTTFNLGAHLATVAERRVLLVDFDPQCNLTMLFFGSGPGETPEVLRSAESNVRMVLTRLLESPGAGSLEEASAEPLLVEHDLYSGLFLLAGCPSLTEMVPAVADAISRAQWDSAADKARYNSIAITLRDCAAAVGADYVLCDLGPSLGAINQLVLFSTDRIILPVTADAFCLQAIRSNVDAIIYWRDRHANIEQTYSRYCGNLECLPKAPSISGAVLLDSSATEKSSVHIEFQHQLADVVTTLIAELEALDEVARRDIDPMLGNLPRIPVQVAVAQYHGRAAFDVSSDHALAFDAALSGAAAGGFDDRARLYGEAIRDIADRIQEEAEHNGGS